MVATISELMAELKRQKVAPERLRDLRPAVEVELEQSAAYVSSGLADLDRISGGGWPVGALSELVVSTGGGAALLHAALRAAAARGESIVLIDPFQGLDPLAATAAGVSLDRLLWVRPAGTKSAARAVELLLRAGGFSLVVLDLQHLWKPPRRRARDLSTSVWLRLGRRARESKTVVLVFVSSPQVTAPVLSIQIDYALRWSGAIPRLKLRFVLRRGGRRD